MSGVFDMRAFSGKSEYVYQGFLMAFIYILAFVVRLFSVLRFESIIHEFDPWFNFRATRFLAKEGFVDFNNWFDNKTWYPLGRWVGNTVYPGLMWTASLLHKIAHSWNLPLDIREVCVFLAPFMASNTTIVVYLITTEVWTSAAGITAAVMVALTPGYISRSVAGSYDNEAVAIFAMLITFYTWIRAVKTGSMAWAGASALCYFYMVAAWGGYIFILNILPIHVLALLCLDRFSHRVYIAYSTWYPLATLLSMNIGFVGFQPVSSTEHAGAFGVFVILQAYQAFHYLHTYMSKQQFRYIIFMILGTIAACVALVVLLAVTETIPLLSGRLKSLLGAKGNIAIVKSVSEHQPTAWGTFFLDLHMTSAFVIPGLFFCFSSLTDENIFIILYLLFSAYFSAIMVRIILVLAPVVCILAGIGFSETLLTLAHLLQTDGATPLTAMAVEGDDQEARRDRSRSAMQPVNKALALAALLACTSLGYFYVTHSTHITSVAHSSPNVILQSTRPDGSRQMFDDFREAYQWLRKNTAEDAKVMSWWDYGYQITGMGNRTTIVDNNTRNNTHIATVGLAMASNEDRAVEIMRSLDVDYALVVFGGYIGYSSDDINKFLWMIRISGGIYPEVVEQEYLTPRGQYTMDERAPARMLHSLMYSMCYYRFDEAQLHPSIPVGYDRTRNANMGRKGIQFNEMEEAFTSEHWMVRIYRVLPPSTYT